MSFEIGQKVWFVAGQQEKCPTCDQPCSAVTYDIRECVIKGWYETRSAWWAHNTNQMTDEPEGVRSAKSYAVWEEDAGNLAGVPENALFETREEAEEIADQPASGRVVMLRAARIGMQFEPQDAGIVATAMDQAET